MVTSSLGGDARQDPGDHLADGCRGFEMGAIDNEPGKRSRIGESTRSPAFVHFYLSFLATHLVP